ncbi:MAG: hypothetical protein IJN65_03275 [Clostridia bacterium]|nr:hypothetical protein [Clostridia bacterium]
MSITSALGLSVICLVLCVIFKQYKAEYSVYINIIAGTIILTAVIGTVIKPLEEIGGILKQVGIDIEYFYLLLKALGICYITQFIGDLCKDAGQTALEEKVYLIGKGAIFVMSFDLLKNLFIVATSFLG